MMICSFHLHMALTSRRMLDVALYVVDRSYLHYCQFCHSISKYLLLRKFFLVPNRISKFVGLRTYISPQLHRPAWTKRPITFKLFNSNVKLIQRRRRYNWLRCIYFIKSLFVFNSCLKLFYHFFDTLGKLQVHYHSHLLPRRFAVGSPSYICLCLSTSLIFLLLPTVFVLS
jgi:hypothetical protein